MELNVLHFVRKSTQLKATFINDQITNHIKYKPSIVIKKVLNKKYDGGFADFNYEKYNICYLDDGNYFKYKYLRKISKSDITKILDFIKQNKIKILHFHYGSDAGMFFEIMKKSGLPSVVSFYGYDASSFPKIFFGYGKRYLQKRVFRYAGKLLAMSEDMKKDFMKSGCSENKIIVHYYGVSGKKYDFPDREYNEKEKCILLIVCSLVPQKGHMFLLKSIKDLINNGINNFRLRIVGTGYLKNSLKDFVLKNKMTEYVDFLGPMKAHSEEILSEYRNADIFVHPSVVAEDGGKEGIPGTIVEAMFCGLPVVSTYHAGIPYIIKDGENGLLVNENDVPKLAYKISILINDVGMRKKLGENARKFAKDNLNLSDKEKELEDIYDSLLNTGDNY